MDPSSVTAFLYSAIPLALMLERLLIKSLISLAASMDPWIALRFMTDALSEYATNLVPSGMMLKLSTPERSEELRLVINDTMSRAIVMDVAIANVSISTTVSEYDFNELATSSSGDRSTSGMASLRSLILDRDAIAESTLVMLEENAAIPSPNDCNSLPRSESEFPPLRKSPIALTIFAPVNLRIAADNLPILSEISSGIF